MTEQGEHSESASAEIAQRLREELGRRRISRQALAEMARVSLSTLEKALSGSRPFTLATVVRLEDVLGVPLRGQAPRSAPEPGLAPEHMGAYSRAAVRWIEGEYLTLRPSFDRAGAVYSYCTRIEWDDAAGHLRFMESSRADAAFTQQGFVSLPNLSGHIYLVTSELGQFRMIMLSRATRERRMFGLLSTLQAGTGSQLIPIAAPIALIPREQFPDAPYGVLEGSAEAAELGAVLAGASANDFVRWRG